MLTASSIARVAACPASDALPHVERATPYATRGTWLHTFLAAVGRVGREEALALVPGEYRDACAAIDLDGLPIDPEAYASEVTLAYDPVRDHGRELGRHLGRDYSAIGPGEIPGTTDVLGLAVDAVVVPDYKTGGQLVTRARENWQLRFLAVAAARAYGRSAARVAIIYVPPDGGPPWFDRATFDAMDLDAIADELREIVLRRDEARSAIGKGVLPVLREGSHCDHCPAFALCPAKVSLIRAATEQGFEKRLLDELVTGQPAAAYRVWRALEQVTGRLGEQVKGYAMAHPFEVREGVIYGPVAGGREEIDGAIARAALADRVAELICRAEKIEPNPLLDPEPAAPPEGASDDENTAYGLACVARDRRLDLRDKARADGRAYADEACSFETTKTAVNNLAKSLAMRLGQKIAPIERELLEAIRERGGIAKPLKTSVREHAAGDPKPLALGAAS